MPGYDCLHEKIVIMENKLDEHHNALESHDRRLSDLSAALHENTALTKQIADNTGEMVALFKEAKIVIKWGGTFKKLSLWIFSISASITGAFYAIKLWLIKWIL